MARYKFLLIWIFLLLSAFFKLHAQTLVIKGKVLDINTREELAGAIIKLNAQVVVSNEKGEFEIAVGDTRENRKLILITYIGYEEKWVNLSELNVSGDQTILLKPADHLLNQMLVTAGRYEQSVKKMIVSTEVIQPYLIQNRNTTMMDKLLDQIPSVNMVDGQINIRSGSGWTYGVGSRVMVLLDDMPFLTGDAGQVKWNFVPIENVQQVEVVKGASSVLYGSSALSGIVHFRTEMAKDKPITRFTVFSGAYSDAERGSLKWSTKLHKQYGVNGFHSFRKKNFQMAVSGNYFRDEGYRMGESENRLRINSHLKMQSKKNIQYGVHLGSLISDGGSFLLWESYEKGYTILDSLVTRTRSLNFYADPYCSFYTGAFKHHVRGRWMYISNDIFNPDPNINQDNSSHNYYGEYQIQRYITRIKMNLTAGMANQAVFSNSPLYNGEQKSRNHALFLQLDQAIGKRINYSAGARFEYFYINGKEESKPVFRTGMNIEITKSTFLRSSFGQGYRFPSIAERYIQTSVGALNIFPNPYLKSETGWNAELGLKQGFSWKKVKGFFDLAFFYTRYQNMIDFNLGVWKTYDFMNPFGSIGFKTLNVGETRIQGFDFSMNAEGNLGKIKLQTLLGYTYTNPIMLDVNQIFASDSLGLNYSFRNTRSDSSDMLKYRFRHLFKWDVQLAYHKWQMGFSVRYNSRMENIDAAFIQLPLSAFLKGVAQSRAANTNGNAVVDMRLAYLLNAKMKIALIINNLLNAEVMTRPADIRPPRLTIIQFNYSL